jgi:hypothetical protein
MPHAGALTDMGRDLLRLFLLVNPGLVLPSTTPPSPSRVSASPSRASASPVRPERGWLGPSARGGRPPSAPATPPPVPPAAAPLVPSGVPPSCWAADVVLVVEGGARRVHAHRFMLAARSSFFAAMFQPAWREADAPEVRSLGGAHGAACAASLMLSSLFAAGTARGRGWGGGGERPGVCVWGRMVLPD